MYSPYSAARAFGQLSSILRSVMTVTLASTSELKSAPPAMYHWPRPAFDSQYLSGRGLGRGLGLGL
jgi:hypothetical protein